MGLCDVTKGIDISPWLVTTLYLVVVLNLNQRRVPRNRSFFKQAVSRGLNVKHFWDI